MTPRFRMVAGPNGSGKSTLTAWLARAFDVNFYTLLNADVFYVQAREQRRVALPFSVDGTALSAYAAGSAYAEGVKRFFHDGSIVIVDDCVQFRTLDSANSYTVALVTNFLQSECIARRISFSQETVFSHPSKVEALRQASEAGYRTYFYFVATCDPAVNTERVRNRYAQGGHDVPDAKIVARYVRSLAQVQAARPFLSRAFFFDNSGDEMKLLASWSAEEGLALSGQDLPVWFTHHVLPYFGVDSKSDRIETSPQRGSVGALKGMAKWTGSPVPLAEMDDAIATETSK